MCKRTQMSSQHVRCFGHVVGVVLLIPLIRIDNRWFERFRWLSKGTYHCISEANAAVLLQHFVDVVALLIQHGLGLDRVLLLEHFSQVLE